MGRLTCSISGGGTIDGHEPGTVGTAVGSSIEVAPTAPPTPTHAFGAQVDPIQARAASVGRFAVASLGIGAALVAGRAIGLHAPACPMRALTGIPCPGCGMTRVADAMAHGQLDEGLRADAAGVALVVVLAVVAVTYLAVVVVRRHPPPRWMGTWGLAAVLGVLVAAHWITTIATGGMLAS